MSKWGKRKNVSIISAIPVQMETTNWELAHKGYKQMAHNHQATVQKTNHPMCQLIVRDLR